MIRSLDNAIKPVNRKNHSPSSSLSAFTNIPLEFLRSVHVVFQGALNQHGAIANEWLAMRFMKMWNNLMCRSYEGLVVDYSDPNWPVFRVACSSCPAGNVDRSLLLASSLHENCPRRHSIAYFQGYTSPKWWTLTSDWCGDQSSWPLHFGWHPMGSSARAPQQVVWTFY